MYYFKYKEECEDCFLVLEPCDWSEDEWKTIVKLFGMVEAERIVVRDYTLEAYGTPTQSWRDCITRQSGDLYGPREK